MMRTSVSPMKRRAFLPLTAAWITLFISGCSQGLLSITLPVAFDEKESHRHLRPGFNTVQSRINFRKSFGGSANCIGGLVTLVPATPYAIAWMSEFYANPDISWPVGKSAFMEKNHPQYFVIAETEAFTAASRQTLCNTDSRFDFRNLADGDYFIMANVQWRYWGHPPEVGSLVTRFSLAGGEHKTLIWPEGLIPLD